METHHNAYRHPHGWLKTICLRNMICLYYFPTLKAIMHDRGQTFVFDWKYIPKTDFMNWTWLLRLYIHTRTIKRSHKELISITKLNIILKCNQQTDLHFDIQNVPFYAISKVHIVYIYFRITQTCSTLLLLACFSYAQHVYLNNHRSMWFNK